MTEWVETAVVETVASLVFKAWAPLVSRPAFFSEEMHGNTFSSRPGINNALPTSHKEVAK